MISPGAAEVLGPGPFDRGCIPEQHPGHHRDRVAVTSKDLLDPAQRPRARAEPGGAPLSAAAARHDLKLTCAACGCGPVDVLPRQISGEIECARIAEVRGLPNASFYLHDIPVFEGGQRLAVSCSEADADPGVRLELYDETRNEPNF